MHVACGYSIYSAVLGSRRGVASVAKGRSSLTFRRAAAVSMEDDFADAVDVHDLLCDAAAAGRATMVVYKFSGL